MSDSILFKAPRFFDGLAGSVREQVYVAVQDGLIRDVGAISELGADVSAQFERVVELPSDATLMPGLINMHTHVSFSGTPSIFRDQLDEPDTVKMIRIVETLHAALAVGITTVRDCGTWPRLALPARDAIESGLLRGPRMITSGAITTTGGHCWFCASEADSEDEVRKAVRAHVKDGVDFIKLFATGGNTTPGSDALIAQFTEEQMCAATEEARKAGRRTAAHAHALDGVRRSIKARVTTIEHCSFQTADGIGWNDAMVNEVLDAGIYVCPTIFRGYAKIALAPEHEPRPGDEAFLKRRKERFNLTRQLADKGVKLVSGNDAGVSNCVITDYPGDLVETAKHCGMSAGAVLRSATSVAAEALGRSELGVLARGKAADLFAVHGNPLEDITAIVRPVLVVARGNIQPYVGS